MELLELADKLFTGELPIEAHHPFASSGEMAEVQPGLAFVDAFANSAAVDTGDGLVVVDTSGVFHAKPVHDTIRSWSSRPLHTAVFTHGHIDHVFGVDIYEEEARTNGWPAPRVIAHRAIAERFERYRMTAGYNAVINQRQFKAPGLRWPTEYRLPDETYTDTLSLRVGGETFELYHDRGETDDATWVWSPDRKVLFAGDMFIWASPNCGNPQKAQRYARDWAIAFRKMVALEPDILLPGHGLPIVGADRVRRALTEGAELLESLVGQTLALMNEGARLDDIVQTVRAPEHLLERPYLHAVYAARLAARALEVAAAGDLRLAGHLAELAAQAAPDDTGVHAARAEVFGARANKEASTMSKGIFSWAEHESLARAKAPG